MVSHYFKKLSKKHKKNDTFNSLVYLFKWLLLACFSGFSGCFLVYGFRYLLSLIDRGIKSLPIPLFLWIIPAALICGLVIYKLQPRAAGEGLPSYIKGMRGKNGRMNGSVTIGKFFAALLTLSCFGSGGIIGPLGRVSAGISNFIVRQNKVLFTHKDRRTSSICGFAAVVGTVFNAPIGAGIFAVEIIRKKTMTYIDVFPAILSSTVATLVMTHFKFDPIIVIRVPHGSIDTSLLFYMLILVLISGYVGGLVINTYEYITRTIGRARGKIVLKLLVGSFLAVLLGWMINPELLGTSNNTINAILSHDLELLSGRLGNLFPLHIIFLIMMLTKVLSNVVTVASGMSAGFTAPMAITGMLLGSAFALMVGVPVGTESYYVFIAIGFCGVLTSSMNIPLAAAIITIEIFGLDFSIPAALSAIVAFQVTKSRTIYDYSVTMLKNQN